MRVDDFDYHLPEALIAQEAIEPRDAARLLWQMHDSIRPSCRDLVQILSPAIAWC